MPRRRKLASAFCCRGRCTEKKRGRVSLVPQVNWKSCQLTWLVAGHGLVAGHDLRLDLHRLRGGSGCCACFAGVLDGNQLDIEQESGVRRNARPSAFAVGQV
jgi:hypothetical protein